MFFMNKSFTYNVNYTSFIFYCFLCVKTGSMIMLFYSLDKVKVHCYYGRIPIYYVKKTLEFSS